MRRFCVVHDTGCPLPPLISRRPGQLLQGPASRPPTPCGTPYPARSRHPPSPGPGRRPEPGETGSRGNSLGARTRVSFGLRSRLFQVALRRREVRPASKLSSSQGSSGLGRGRTGKLFTKRRRDAQGSSRTRRRRKDGQPACRGAHVPQGTALGLSPALGHCGQPTVRRRTWPRSDPTAHRQVLFPTGHASWPFSVHVRQTTAPLSRAHRPLRADRAPSGSWTLVGPVVSLSWTPRCSQKQLGEAP